MDQGRISINNHRLKNCIYLAVIIGGYLVFFYIYSITSDKEVTTCPFKNVTGIPCPGCGMGRATLELVHFDIKESLRFHPLAIPFNLAVVVAVFWLFRDVVKDSNSFIKFVKSRPNRWVLFVIGGMLIVVWVRNIINGI